MNMNILFEGTSFELLEIKTKHNDWHINRLCDEVLIEVWDEDGNGSTTLTLNQDELKTLIEFLQTKLK